MNQNQPSGGCPSFADSCKIAETLSLDDVHSFLSENWDGPSHSVHVPIVPGGFQPAVANSHVEDQSIPFITLRSSPSSYLDGPQETSPELATCSAADEPPAD